MSDILLVKFKSSGVYNYGVVTNKSFPKVASFGEHLDAAYDAVSLGEDFCNSLGFNYNLDNLADFEEVEYDL